MPTRRPVRARLVQLTGALALVVVLLVCTSGDSRSPSWQAADRLDDRGEEFSLIADHTWRRTLDTSVDEHRFALGDAQRGTRLLVSPGIAVDSPGGHVRFEITWQRGHEPAKTIYHRELSGPGWREELVPLPDGPGDVRLRKTAAAGSDTALKYAGWGNPTLLAASRAAQPSVILISVDTVRADRLGAYGRREATTPALDAFARSGIQYASAYSPSTWTVPSHESLLYGIQAKSLPATKLRDPALGSVQSLGFEPLAEAFRNAGYLTAAFTGGGFMNRGFGMGRGFDAYFAYAAPDMPAGTCPETRFDGGEVFERAIRWLRARAGAPVFLFVHTYDAHDRCPVVPIAPLNAPRKPDAAYSLDEREAVIRYYDTVVTRADRLVGDLLREVDSLGLADSTVVAITSDHGESLWEHGYFGHGCEPAYDELSRVPLMLRLPRSMRRRQRVDTPVSLVDLAPTLLALTNIPIPASMQGGMLPGLGLGADQPRPIYVLCGDWLAVRKDDWKFMISRVNRQRMFFNTRDDPGERTDLAKKSSLAKDELRALARAYWPKRPRPADQPPAIPQIPPQPLAPADAERLRVLGYGQ